MKTTVKSPIDVVATAVNRTLLQVMTGRSITAKLPPSGVFDVQPAKIFPNSLKCLQKDSNI